MSLEKKLSVKTKTVKKECSLKAKHRELVSNAILIKFQKEYDTVDRPLTCIKAMPGIMLKIFNDLYERTPTGQKGLIGP